MVCSSGEGVFFKKGRGGREGAGEGREGDDMGFIAFLPSIRLFRGCVTSPGRAGPGPMARPLHNPWIVEGLLRALAWADIDIADI